MSLWESLLDDINALKNKKVPADDDAPRLQSLLRQVNELAGATPPFTGAGEGGQEAAKPKPLAGTVQSLPPSLRKTTGVEPAAGEEPKPAKAVEPVSLDDEDELRGFLARHKPTKDDLTTLVGLAGELKRQKEADPKAFEEQPEIARKFLAHFEARKREMLHSLMRKLQGREPEPKHLDEVDIMAAAIAQDGANEAMTMAAAARTAGEKGRNPERDQEFGMVGVDPELFRPGEIKSQGDLKKALAAMGPGAFVVGFRPLPGSLYRDPEAGSRADVENREVHHKHIFYLDADGTLRDAGFFEEGIKKGQEGRDKRKELQAGESDELDKLGRYRFGHIENGGDLRPETFDLKSFDASNYRRLTHNCQHYVEAALKRMRQTQGRAPQE